MKHAKDPLRSPWRVFAVAVVAVAAVFGAIFVATRHSSSGSSSGGTDNASSDSPATAQPATTTTRPPYNGWVDPESSGEPWATKTVGLLTFRGNPTRSYYGQGRGC
jgi:hypothetical protein